MSGMDLPLTQAAASGRPHARRRGSPLRGALALMLRRLAGYGLVIASIVLLWQAAIVVFDIPP